MPWAAEPPEPLCLAALLDVGGEVALAGSVKRLLSGAANLVDLPQFPLAGAAVLDYDAQGHLTILPHTSPLCTPCGEDHWEISPQGTTEAQAVLSRALQGCGADHTGLRLSR